MRPEGHERRIGRDGGSLSVELVVLSPVIALFGLLGLGLGRYEMARELATAAARAGAEAASVAQGVGQVESSASGSAGLVLAGHSETCARPQYVVDVGSFAADGAVRVSVTCVVPMTDLDIPGLPSSMTVSVSETEPIDPYRTVQ